jgi:hypothetical protein
VLIPSEFWTEIIQAIIIAVIHHSEQSDFMYQKNCLPMGFTHFFLLTLFSTLTSFAATVAWDGEAGNFSWQTAANWSGDILPDVNDDVVIHVSSNITVHSAANVTIRSLQCSNNLALSAGTFRVTADDSTVREQLFVTGNPVVSATGAGTHFMFPSATNINGAGVAVLSGATISFPGLLQYNKGAGCGTPVWEAAGANSALNAANVTNLTGGACATLTLRALSGGSVLLPGLTTIEEGTVVVLVDGTNSLVDLIALQHSPGTLRTVSFEARNHGSISTTQFVGGKRVMVTLKPGGTLPVEQMGELHGFTVVGTNVNFSSLTNLTGGNITVSSNALVTAPNLVSHDANFGCFATTWLVTGPDSTLDFSQITNIVGASCGFIEMKAGAGGTFILSNLTTVSEGTAIFSAEGTNSLVDLSALQQCNATTRNVSFEASNAGTIWMPQFSGGPRVLIALDSGGNLPAAQMRELSGFSVTGMNLEFSALTNLTFGDVTVNGGANVSTPVLAQHNLLPGCYSKTWMASGTGSVLDLSPLNALTGPTCGFLNISAKAGGTVLLNLLPEVSNGTITFSADGDNSVMNLNALTQTAGSRTIGFEASNDGTIVAPLFFGNTNVTVSLESDGVFPAAQMRRLLGFSVSDMTVEFSALTNLAPGNVTVSEGGIATAPNLTQHSESNDCIANTWQATGVGSVLDFSGLTHLTGTRCGALNVQARAGGQVLLGNLAMTGEGILAFLSDGTNSLLDLGALTASASTNFTVSFEARNNGTLSVPVLQGGETVTITSRTGGDVDTSALKLLKSLTVSGTSLNLPGITNLFAGDLIVDQGASLILPNVFNHSQSNGCVANSWSVSGAGSVLELSSMTNIAGSSCGSLAINALAGGRLNLSNLVTISEGAIAFLTDGTNSQADLSKLRSSLAISRIVSFEARNAGSIFMPEMSGGRTVSIIIKTNGILPAAQLTLLKNVTILGTNVTLTSLTNIDNGSFTVSDSATILAPNLATYAKGADCDPATWLASGTGSVLNLSGLTQLTGGACVPLTILATNSGQILLGNLGHVPSGSVHITSSGAGSIVDLQSLSNFLHASNLSTLIATNGGAIELSDQPLFLSGVSLHLADGTPGFPFTTFSGTNLIMHGRPWRSYWVESRNTMSDLNPWLFLRRVPLTNEFQIIAPLAFADSAFRAREFVSDPSLLDLMLQDGLNVQLVLYASTNRTHEIQTTTDLVPGTIWETLDTVTMTNTFRLIPLEPLTQPQRFYRAQTL